MKVIHAYDRTIRALAMEAFNASKDKAGKPNTGLAIGLTLYAARALLDFQIERAKTPEQLDGIASYVEQTKIAFCKVFDMLAESARVKKVMLED